MAGMDSPAAEEEPPATISPDEYIAKKLGIFGVEENQSHNYCISLKSYLHKNPSKLHDIIIQILDAGTDVIHAGKEQSDYDIESNNFYSASLKWLQWLMFQDDPALFLEELLKKSAGQRAVCGSVWGHNDLAYRCRTCEHDPTCAICVPCFQNGNHKDHDYSIMYTGGGCCDCGDATAWKREGFCSRHKGAEQIQPLSDELADSVGPVLDSLLSYWMEKVCIVELPTHARGDSNTSSLKIANELTTAIVNMLLEFCQCSESMLSFVSKRIYKCVNLLEVLLQAERKLDKKVVKKLHELLLKLLSEPVFKYEFAKIFIRHYPSIVKEFIKGSNYSSFEESSLLASFSVQIFTVPTLTARLVREVDLLGVLLGCIKDLFQSCVEEDRRLQANKWANLYDTSVRLVEDIRYVLSHQEVLSYVTRERTDIADSWIHILSLIQGMDPQKRVTTIHTEDENENLAAPFMLAFYLGNVNKLLVRGVLYTEEKRGSHSGGQNMGDGEVIPQSAASMIFDCIRMIEGLMEPDLAQAFELNFAADSIFNSSSPLIKLRKRPLLHGLGATKSAKVGPASQPSGSPSSSALSDDSLPNVDPDSENKEHTLDTSFWPRISFDVSSQEVSFHIPLHRLLSLLLRSAMNKMFRKDENPGKTNYVPSFAPSNFFNQFLKGFSHNRFAAIVLELPLRIRVICAQVRAGMWRRNGDAAILSTEWYRSVQLFEQGLESDLFLMQCCAALAPPDLFVETIQERFGLSSYTSLELKEHNEYEPVLVQEMLTLLIQIVKERRFCGLSSVDNLKREVIYKLAVGDATHSQIVKSLPRDLSDNEQLQGVLDMLAVYSRPSGLKQGKYSLRKQYWSELDLYHPRWNSRELQLAEERFYNFCKASALNAQLPCWTDAFYPLNTISNIATSKSVLQIVRAVLFHAVHGSTHGASRAPDNVLVTALHLISLALDICYSKARRINRYSSDVSVQDNQSWVVSSYAEMPLPFIEHAAEVLILDSNVGKKESLLSLLVSLLDKFKVENESAYSGAKYCDVPSLVRCQLKKFAELSKECLSSLKVLAPDVVSSLPGSGNLTGSQDLSPRSADRKMMAQKRQLAIMEKMKAAQSKFAESMKNLSAEEFDDARSKQGVTNSADGVSEEPLPVCSLCRESHSQSPLCYLILLQKSRLTSFVERSYAPGRGDQSIKASGSRRKEEIEVATDTDSSSPMQIDQEIGIDLPFETGSSDVNYSGTLGEENLRMIYYAQQTVPPGASQKFESLKMMEYDILNAVAGYLNSSTASACVPPQTSATSKKSRTRKCPILGTYISCISKEYGNSDSSPVQHLESSSRSPALMTKDKFGPLSCNGIHVSSCGHAMHQDCHSRYLQSLKQRFIRRLGFEGGHIVDPDLGELLCPVCRRFANSILPASQYISRKYGSPVPSGAIPLSPKIFWSLPSATSGNLQISLALSLLKSTAKIVGEDKYLSNLSNELNDATEPSLEPCIQRLNMLYLPPNSTSHPAELSQSLFLWDTVRYTLNSMEIAARARMREHSDGSSHCLETLHHELNSSGGFILSLLFSVAHSVRNLNHLELLLRFKGIQLFASAVCFGICGDDDIFSSNKRIGMLSPVFGTSIRTAFPYNQFWKQCADPVIAHDPFASLLWVLYCLPAPALSCSELFFPLVHLFYAVSFVQSLITSYMQDSFDRSSFNDCPLDGVCKTMSEYRPTRQQVSLDYSEQVNPKDTVRRLTLPYLRRCSLLLKLLSSASSTPSYGNPNIWELSSALTSGSVDSLSVELSCLKELEDHLQIPSFDIVLHDESIHALALRWCQHFAEDFKRHRHGAPFLSFPALPFRLLQLPLVYQDLLERYVKMQCSDCGTVPDEPTLCLLCGKLCSPNWKPCCSTSKCINHAKECAAGIGVFLLVRKTTILLQRSARLAFWASPYLDAFGEEDHDIQRGRPLYLSEERYAALTYLVASHSLDQTSEVLRHTTIGLFGSD